VDDPKQPIRVVFSQDVIRACGFPGEPPKSPNFELVSSRLRARGDDVLVHLVTCVAERKLHGETLRVIGFTDPRGAPEYNHQLGMYRAIATKQHLVDLGLPASVIDIESAGERDSRGTEPDSWALDRRVEIHLVGGTSRPL
jgi:outer membrane protein OmpA-like peptidoglycan-associated protein